ncbi:MAG: hypothetical protein ACM3Q4_14485 [Acidobacteriota bacterium]
MKQKLAVLLAVLVMQCYPLRAQGPIDVFGYVQTSYTNFHNVWKQGPPEGEANYKFHYMGVNQLNLMFGKDFGSNLSGLINLEFVNNYSSDKGFGSFKLQEAYVRWDYSDHLKVKFGMVIPQFNALYEIYNKAPLLPYIQRPKLYEANAGNTYDLFDMLPQKALIHINGSVPIGESVVEYAGYAGNPPNNFIVSPSNPVISPSYAAYGQSGVNYLSYGARLGFSHEHVRAGISYSADKENQRSFVTSSDGGTADLGDLPRYRIGADIQATAGGFTLSAEYMATHTTVPKAAQDSIDRWHAADPYGVGAGFQKKFYYVTLQYDITDELFVYTMYDYLNDEHNPFYFGMDGYYGYSIGGGYRVNDSVVLKFQAVNNKGRYNVGEEVDPIRDYDEYQYMIGASMTF